MYCKLGVGEIRKIRSVGLKLPYLIPCKSGMDERILPWKKGLDMAVPLTGSVFL